MAATPARAPAAAAVVHVQVERTVAMIAMADVSLYLQHKLKYSLVTIIIQAVPMAIPAGTILRIVIKEVEASWTPLVAKRSPGIATISCLILIGPCMYSM